MPVLDHIAALPQEWTDANPLWQGPQGEGPQGGVTQSMMNAFMGCRERFRARYILGLEPAPSWKPSIGYGHQWHTCEEAHAANLDWQEPLTNHTADQFRLYPFQRDEIAKWHNVCMVQFPEYVRYWSQHPDVTARTPLMQEQVFDVPYELPSGRVVRLRGKFDSVDLIEGKVFLQENKTKSKVNRSDIERSMSFDLQTVTYIIALEAIRRSQDFIQYPMMKPYWWLIGKADAPIAGVRYNVVLRDCPIKQHEAKVKRGKRGRKTIPDEPDTIIPAETTEAWMERLRCDYYAAAPEDYFFRLKCELLPGDVEKFKEQFLHPFLENLCWWYDWVTDPDGFKITNAIHEHGYPSPTWRKPFGTYDSLDEGGFSDYDSWCATGSTSGLRRAQSLFGELQP